MDYRIKDLPKCERPREKLEQNGSSSMTEVELLSLILRTGTSGKNVKELSADILSSYSLGSFADRTLDELQEFQGISKVKSGQLKALGELARRMQKEEKEDISSFSDIKPRVQDMKFMEKEVIRILILSSGNKLLNEIELEGEVSSASFSPRKVFRKALLDNASAIILVHNHPSGNPNPTDRDIKTTREIVELGKSLGVEVLDHIIVGNTVESMRSGSAVEF
ncbi:MAG: DNA repair protein RadC [Candidatus Nanohaloarchaea archaeon]|jgi:DNA repair protein RadC